MHLYQRSLSRRWRQFTRLHHGNTSDVGIFIFHCYILISNAVNSDCYSIEPWTLRWSKQIRMRMYAFLLYNSQYFLMSTRSAHADLQGNSLAVSNLDDGLDIYSLPNMQLMKNCSHGNTNDRIFKVAFVANDQLVSGGKGGCARVYDVQSGQLLQTLEHDKGELSLRFAFRSLYFVFFALRQTAKLCKL